MMLKNKSIKIGFEDYTIEFDAILSKYDKLGRIIYDTTQIIIDSGVTKQAAANILIHEILHGISTRYLTTGLSEEQVEVLANCLSMVFRDNYKLWIDIIKETAGERGTACLNV